MRRSRHAACESWLRVRLWPAAAGPAGLREHLGGRALPIHRLEHAARAALRADDALAERWLGLDRRLLALERIRVGLGQRALGARAARLRLRRAVLRLLGRAVHLHAGLLDAARAHSA